MASITVKREGGQAVEDIKWAAQELEIVEKPNGAAGAAIIASGIGVAALGFFTTMNEASARMHDFLNFQNRVGPLSGKTTMAGIIWLVAWALLAPALWKRNVPMNTVLIVTAILLVIGAVGTYPKFFTLFAE